jgi:hypothetical protein
MYGCQQNLINPSSELKAVLEFICSESHKLLIVVSTKLSRI